MLSIRQVLDGYRTKKFSPVEVTKEYLKRAKQAESLNAFILLTEETSLNQAKISEMRWSMGYAGRLEGVPLSYKDNIHVKGIPATSGSRIDQNFVPKQNAPVISTLLNEGAVMVGKTNMHEFAFGITNNNPFYGPARNPWNPDYISGGSSGGSAVSVAAELSAASIGTDTGGSIRIPASCCGLIGLKPTHGLINNDGVTPISWTLDHNGTITKNIDDLALMMEALTNVSYSNADTSLKGRRIGVPSNYFTDRIESEVLEIYKQTLLKLENLGALLFDVEIPHVEEAASLTFTLAIAEAGFVHKDRIYRGIKNYGADVKQVMENAHSISAIDYINALKRRGIIAEAFNHLFNEVDLIIAPTLPILPKPVGMDIVSINGESEPIFNSMIRYTSYFNLTGHPVISIPAGLSREKLPIGVQLIGPKLDEQQLIAAAGVFERHYLEDFYKTREKVCAEQVLNLQ
ncbi:amidase [Siminovitchia acidinfaciens]|uniref:Amidase n=1 Tax=Siminovitchia acidinfaciens TaxID=2321395 RepID=A0A429XWT3_9BACI|nr:amidase [Siminovitchia acidinfaciens]RST72959.1 amidase [Siminovitchia acidinfaciens]